MCVKFTVQERPSDFHQLMSLAEFMNYANHMQRMTVRDRLTVPNI
jgi:hypothetical protein